MSDKLIFIDGDLFDVTLRKFERPSMAVTVRARDKSNVVTTPIPWPPDGYILIGRGEAVRMYNVLLKLTGLAEGKTVMTGEMMSPLNTGWITPILVQSNFMAPNVALVTGRIIESGMWNFWQELRERRQSLEVFQLLTRSQSKLHFMLSSGNVWAVAFDNKDYAQLQSQMNSQYQALTVHVLTT